jgi:hypothetical protein
MIHDAHNLFSDAQALTAAAASTNLIDLGAVRDLGNGENLYIVLSVDVALADTGSNSTVTVDLQTDDNASFSSNATGQTLFTIAAVAAAGTVYIARIQPGGANERYIRLFYTMNNGDLSAGSVTAEIVHDVQKYVSYAKGYTVS